MTLLSLCSGIGGLELGLEAGLGCETVGQAEKDPYARGVLARHWPDVYRVSDVREIGPEWRGVDVVCGGFPCQPHSLAGKRKASGDDRDLWPEMVRILREVRPRFFVGENVPGLLSSEGGAFFGNVLGDLYDLGYAVEWEHLPAVAVGAPHRRDRVFLVARLDGGVTWPNAVPLRKLTGKWPKAGRVDPATGTAEARERRWTARDAAWPTPNAGCHRSGMAERYGPGERRSNLHDAVALWPTPSAGLHNYDEDPETWEVRRAAAAERHGNNGIGTPLGIAVRLWPTPKATDWRSGAVSDEVWEKNARPLCEAVHRNPGPLWPTPNAADAKMVKQHGRGNPSLGTAAGVWRDDGSFASGGRLNPDWVEWLMGLPTGWTRPDGPSLHGVEALPFHPEPDIPRVTLEKRHRVPRLRCLGNAVVPQVAYVIGAAIRASLVSSATPPSGPATRSEARPAERAAG